MREDGGREGGSNIHQPTFRQIFGPVDVQRMFRNLRGPPLEVMSNLELQGEENPETQGRQPGASTFHGSIKKHPEACEPPGRERGRRGRGGCQEGGGDRGVGEATGQCKEDGLDGLVQANDEAAGRTKSGDAAASSIDGDPTNYSF